MSDTRYMDDQTSQHDATPLIAQDTQMLAQHWPNVEPILSIASLLAGELLCERCESLSVCVFSGND